MGLSLSLPGVSVQGSPFNTVLSSAVVRRVSRLPGLRHLMLPDWFQEGQNPISGRDGVSGEPLYATLTRSPIPTTPATGWGGRRVFDNATINNNLQIQGFQPSTSFSFFGVCERPASAFYLFQTLDQKLEALLLNTGTLNFRVNGAADTASQLSGNIASAWTTRQPFLISFDGVGKTAAIYVGDENIAFYPTDFANGISATPDVMWLYNSGASNGLIGKIGMTAIFDEAYHLPKFNTSRGTLFFAARQHYGL